MNSFGKQGWGALARPLSTQCTLHSGYCLQACFSSRESGLGLVPQAHTHHPSALVSCCAAAQVLLVCPLAWQFRPAGLVQRGWWPALPTQAVQHISSLTPLSAHHGEALQARLLA